MPSYNEQLNLAGHRRNTVYTYFGSVVGGIELTGVDPSSVSDDVAEGLTSYLRNVFQFLPVSATVTQYYVHYDGVKVKLRDRDNARSQLLSKRREAFLNNKRNLNGSRLFWIIEMEPEETLNSVFSVSFLKNLFNSMFDKDARKKVGLAFQYRDAFLIEEQSFRRECQRLSTALEDLNARLSFFSPDNKTMEVSDIWRLNKFLGTFNASYLRDRSITVPENDWDHYSLDGENGEVIMVDGVAMLKLNGSTPIYVRIASITRFGQSEVPQAVWASDKSGSKRPSLLRGNYVIFNRFKPYSVIKKSLVMNEKENELIRSQLKFSDLITAKSNSEEMEMKIEGNQKLKRMRDELLAASDSPDKQGDYTSSIAVFSHDPNHLLQQCRELDRVVTNSMSLIWETAGLENSYLSMQMGYRKSTYRTMTFNTSKLGATSLFYKSHTGIKTWLKDFEEEESFYILESDDGVPFYYTPKVGEKLLVIGVGPTRSGKSFFKNVLASHFSKFGGIYTSLDVDDGTIPLANFFQKDGGVFTVTNERENGLNSFSTSYSDNDTEFVNHIIDQISLMMLFNQREEDKYLTADEKKELASSIGNLLYQQYDPENKDRITVNTLSTLMAKCSRSIQDKIAVFVKNGYLAHLFDNEKDAIGVLDKPLSVYNLAAVKEQKQQAQLVQHEIFYRTVRLFESAKYRTLPKYLDIDEAQYTLSVDGAAEWAIAKSRTWFKHGGGMGFWTQSPEHYSNLAEWHTLRGAASVFIFMSDPQADTEEYCKTFSLTEGQVNIIRNLKPRQQAFFVIPELNISKVINLFVESEQYVICTSSANEASLAKDVYKKYPNDIDKAVSEIVNKLGKEPTLLDTKEQELTY